VLHISCLHSAQSNIAVFEAARRALRLDDVMLKHRVRSDLLLAADAAGRASDDILRQTADELVAVASGAQAVLLTCSTLGAAAALARPLLPIPVHRVDEALAAAATAAGGPVVVLCAVGSTIAPTRAVFEAAAMATGATIEVRLVPGAWALFRADREHDYWQAIAEAADAAASEGATVALAQASMAGAAGLAQNPPLASPSVGLAAVVAAARAAPSPPT
jgi:hypothetical protein